MMGAMLIAGFLVGTYVVFKWIPHYRNIAMIPVIAIIIFLIELGFYSIFQ